MSNKSDKTSVMIDLDDPRTSEIADVISNKTSKKILEFLSSGEEKSESEISNELGMALNTVHYNVQKLVKSGLVEVAKKKMWSVKGKKIDYYRISNRKIVISPKKMIKGVIPAIVGTLIVSLGIKFLSGSSSDIVLDGGTFAKEEMLVRSADSAASALSYSSGRGMSEGVVDSVSNSGFGGDVWLWFLLGALVSLFIYLMWNYFVTSKRFRVKRGFK